MTERSQGQPGADRAVGRPGPAARMEAGEGGASPPVTPRPLEQDLLYRALCRHQWNISAVARELGLSRPTIYRRMRRLGIVPPHLSTTV